jgi:hypothetical protein
VTKLQQKPAIRSMEKIEDNIDENQYDPTITSFMSSQLDYSHDDSIDPYSMDNPSICMSSHSEQHGHISQKPQKYIPRYNPMNFPLNHKHVHPPVIIHPAN